MKKTKVEKDGGAQRRLAPLRRAASALAGHERKIIIGITGASGAIYGIRLLETLREMPGIETHLIISKTGQITLAHETGLTVAQAQKLAHHAHNAADLAACTASGSFETLGMVIAPCSMRSLAEIATGLTGNLLTRSADVVLKERRKLILLTRETPLTLAHIRNMESVTLMGGIIAPPVPAFYAHPQSLEQMVDHTVGRTLDLLGLPNSLVNRWKGLKNKP